MAFPEFVFILMVFIIFTEAEKPLNWDEAYAKCKKQGNILSPLDSINLPSNIHSPRITMWTSGYYICVGCLMGLYVEQRNKSEKHNALCRDNASNVITFDKDNYSNQDFKCFWDHSSVLHPNSLLNISDLKVLEETVEVMQVDEKYWISDIGINYTDYERHCEEYTHFINFTTSKKARSSVQNCKNKKGFTCKDESKYRMTVSLVKLPPHVCAGTSPSKGRITDDLIKESGISTWMLLILVFVTAVLIGIISTCCLMRRWIIGLKRELRALQQQRYHHPMYNSDGVEMIQNRPRGSEPATPASVPGSAFYENMAEETSVSQETNVTESYATSSQVQHSREVNVMVNQPTTQPNGGFNYSLYSVPAPKRPTLGSAVRHNSMVHHTRKLKKRLTSRQISTEPRSSRNNPPHFNKLCMPSEWFNEEKRSEHQTQDKLDTNKPTPKPCPTNTMTGTGRLRTMSENAFYLNIGHNAKFENPEMNNEDEDYENIWQNTL